MQEVAYNSLLTTRRKEIHEKIGQAIETLHGQRLEEFYEMLAYHYSRSGNLPKAYEYLKKAAGKAVQKDAPFEGLRLYKEAMGVLLKLPATAENRKEQIALVLLRAAPERKVGFTEDSLPWLQKAEALAEELGDVRSRLTLRSLLGVYYVVKGGNPSLGWKYLENCSEHPDLIQDIELMVLLGYDLCPSSTILGDFQRISRIAPTIIGLIENSQTQAKFYGRPYNPYSYILGYCGFAAGVLGDFEKGETLLKKGLSFAEEIDHRATLGHLEMLYGLLLSFKGDGPEAIRVLRKTIKDLEESQTKILVGLSWGHLGYAHWLIGDYRTALEYSEKGLKIHSDLGLLFFQSFCHWYCSLAHHSLGNLEEAVAQAEQALKCSLANNEKWAQGISRIVLGRVLATGQPGQFKAAVGHIQQGISLLEELGILPWAGWGYLWLGEVFAKSGRKKEALMNLKKAETMFREMGMDYWLAKAQEVLSRL